MKKRGMKKDVKTNIWIIFIAIFFIILVYYFVQPSFIGYSVFEGNSWNIENSSNFNYNENEIEIIDGVIRLKANISSVDWTTYSEEIFSITKAYYEPDDKTSKITGQDNNNQEIATSKITSFIFSSDLSNGDLVNLYLKDEGATNVYLCNAYDECTSSNLGQLNFPDQAGYYQITIQNLNNPKKIFNLNSDDDIEIDFINSTSTNITKFWYDHKDKTSKVNVYDNTTLEAGDSKILDIVFNQELQDNDIIQLYLKQEDATNIYLCTAGEECTSSNLGSFYFPNQDGYYNLTVQNLNSQNKVFNLNSDEKIKIDFIEAIRITETNHSETNIIYPTSAEITTQDFSITGLKSWDILITNEILNGQNIFYEYSVDSGESWTEIPQDKNLSEVNSTKIRIKAILGSSTTATPELLLMNLTYTTSDVQSYFETNTTGQLEISIRENIDIVINSSGIKTELILLPSTTLDNVELMIAHAGENHSSSLSRFKEVEITAPKLNNNLYNATIKMYYTDEEIKGINESTLKIYYFNEATQSWQERGSIVNTNQNFIEADIEHFSIYGIFGEENSGEEESQSSSPSSSGNSESSGSGESSGGNKKSSSEIASPNLQKEVIIGSQPAQKEQAKEEVQEEISNQAEVIVTKNEKEQTLTGHAIRITKILSNGKINQSLIILTVILIVAYIIVRINEKSEKPRYKTKSKSKRKKKNK
ncbi:hypothetical protein HYT56_02065 [Candidatus Woesearchaeota archaeon]|nr:hypothetical protein [Candidatus Woesearchaeota archaeon]